MKILILVVSIVVLISCGSDSTNRKALKTLSMEEHYKEASKLMCICLEESLKDTSHKSIGSIMNECEINSIRSYRSSVPDSIRIDTTDDENVSLFSIGMTQYLNRDSSECEVLNVYKDKLWRDTNKGER